MSKKVSQKNQLEKIREITLCILSNNRKLWFDEIFWKVKFHKKGRKNPWKHFFVKIHIRFQSCFLWFHRTMKPLWRCTGIAWQAWTKRVSFLWVWKVPQSLPRKAAKETPPMILSPPPLQSEENDELFKDYFLYNQNCKIVNGRLREF